MSDHYDQREALFDAGRWGTGQHTKTPEKRRPLTDQQISYAYFEALGAHNLSEQDRGMLTRFARIIEAAHGIVG